jgi:hypothetical protein
VTADDLAWYVNVKVPVGNEEPEDAMTTSWTSFLLTVVDRFHVLQSKLVIVRTLVVIWNGEAAYEAVVFLLTVKFPGHVGISQ